MKKIISLILVALMLVSVLPMTVGATEKPWQEVDASNTDTTNPVKADGTYNHWYGNNKQWKATKKYFAIQYEVYLAEYAGLEATDKHQRDNCVMGIDLGEGGADTAYIYFDYNAGEKNSEGKFKATGKLNQWPPKGWGSGSFKGKGVDTNVSSLVNTTVKLTVTGMHDETNKTWNFKGYINGKQMINFYGQERDYFTIPEAGFNGNVGWSTRVHYINATARFIESDTQEFDCNAFGKIDVPMTLAPGAIKGNWVKNGTNYNTSKFTPSSDGDYYHLGYGDNYIIEAKMTAGPNYGFLVAVEDFYGDGKVQENFDRYYLVDFLNGGVDTTRNNSKFGDWTFKGLNDGIEKIPDGKKINVGDKFDAKIVVKDNTLSVYANGYLVQRRTIDSYFGNGFGLWSKATDTNPGVFEDLKVTYILDEPAEGKNATGYYQTRGDDLRVILECSKEELKKYAECEITVAFETANGTVTKTYKANVAYTGLDYGENNFYVAPDGYGLIGCEILGITGATSFTAKATLKLADGGTVEIPLGSGNIG